MKKTPTEVIGKPARGFPPAFGSVRDGLVPTNLTLFWVFPFMTRVIVDISRQSSARLNVIYDDPIKIQDCTKKPGKGTNKYYFESQLCTY